MRTIDWPPALSRYLTSRPRTVGLAAALAVHVMLAAAVLLSLRPVTPPPEDRPLSISLVTLDRASAARPTAAPAPTGRRNRREDERDPPSPSAAILGGSPAAGVGPPRPMAATPAPSMPGLGRLFQCLNDAASIGEGPEAEACRRWRKAHIEPGGPPEKLLINPAKEAGYARESARRQRPAQAPVVPCQGEMSNLDFGCPPPKSR